MKKITGNKFELLNFKFGFLLINDDGSVFCPTDEQIDKILNISNVVEVSAQGASGYVVIFSLENIPNELFIEECRKNISIILNE